MLYELRKAVAIIPLVDLVHYSVLRIRGVILATEGVKQRHFGVNNEIAINFVIYTFLYNAATVLHFLFTGHQLQTAPATAELLYIS